MDGVIILCVIIKDFKSIAEDNGAPHKGHHMDRETTR